LSGTGEGNNNKPSGLPAVITLPAKYVMSVIGAAVSISGFVALLTTQSVKTWVKTHPYPIYLALIVAVLVIAGTLNYAYNLRKRITVPSDHDRKLYAAALERLPPDGTVIRWLKSAEMTEASIADFPADVLGALEKTIEFSRMQSIGFDDMRTAESFESLTGAIMSFCQSVDRWTFAAHARQFRPVAGPPSGTPPAGASRPPVSPHATDPELGDETAALTRRHQELVQAYDKFVRTAHARGIDIDG
jgi:hypothetical protein